MIIPEAQSRTKIINTIVKKSNNTLPEFIRSIQHHTPSTVGHKPQLTVSLNVSTCVMHRDTGNSDQAHFHFYILFI